jgi:hypothetical protein
MMKTRYLTLALATLWLVLVSQGQMIIAQNSAGRNTFVQPGDEKRQARLGDGFVPADAPKVSLSGTIDRVSLESGPTMCYLTLRDGKQTETILLGSVRYLMDKNFSPKAGDAIKVQGFRLDDQRIAARRVELPEQKRKLDFRDSDGRPLWSGGLLNRGPQGPLGMPGKGPGRGGQRGMGRGGRRP